MNILVIDGMGGGIGRSIIEHIKNEIADIKITAAGTNSIATAAMLKAGADYGATGENAVVYNCTKADCIIGVMGILLANSMYGEISPKMAEAVSASPAYKILIPIDKCNAVVLGTTEKPLHSYISEVSKTLVKILTNS